MDSTSVLVTGFGPFRGFPINPSWQVVEKLSEMNLAADGIKLITKEIPVVYETVSDQVPQLWKEHEPKLMVHIGVSAYATALTLETCAHKDGYERPDVDGKVPDSPEETLPVVVKTCFDIEEISAQFNAINADGVTSIVSTDAGRYLCEFTFFTSLCIQPDRTVFIHVPNVGNPYTIDQMARGVRDVILLLLDQMKVKCPT